MTEVCPGIGLHWKCNIPALLSPNKVFGLKYPVRDYKNILSKIYCFLFCCNSGRVVQSDLFLTIASSVILIHFTVHLQRDHAESENRSLDQSQGDAPRLAPTTASLSWFPDGSNNDVKSWFLAVSPLLRPSSCSSSPARCTFGLLMWAGLCLLGFALDCVPAIGLGGMSISLMPPHTITTALLVPHLLVTFSVSATFGAAVWTCAGGRSLFVISGFQNRRLRVNKLLRLTQVVLSRWQSDLTGGFGLHSDRLILAGVWLAKSKDSWQSGRERSPTAVEHL